MLLNKEEQLRYAEIGTAVAAALEDVCLHIQAGMSEFTVAGLVSAALWTQGIEPITLLVAADERSQTVRHYVPTSKTIQDGVIVSICARSKGLIVSATRSVAFSPDFAKNYDNLLNVEQAIWNATTPNTPLSDILETAKSAYHENNLTDEWKNHHQGGATGYMARELRVDNFTSDKVLPTQAYAWNPSAKGIKCEDTILLTNEGLKILTPVSSKWPKVTKNNHIRPDILRRNV